MHKGIKKLTFIAVTLFITCIPICGQTPMSFKMIEKISKTISVNRSYVNSESFKLASISKSISGLVISGDIQLNSENSLVRVILLDKKGYEYLVSEFTPQLNPINELFSFDNIGEETILLDNVEVVSLNIVIIDATLNLMSISYSSDDRELSKMKAMKTAESTLKNLREEQLKEKIEKINLYNAKNNRFWVAEVTDLSLQPYPIIKEVLGGGDDSFNTFGYEYYNGGIFMEKGYSTLEIDSIHRIQSIQLSNFPETFDWRNRHGVNWVSDIRKQVGGTCWAFATTDIVEVAASRYFNRQFRLNLSERELISCSYNLGANGGWISRALDYVKVNGILPEDCFPLTMHDWEYDFYTVPCSLKCQSPQEIIKIAGYSTVSHSMDQIMKNIIFHGPLGFSFRHSDPTGGHAVELIGYKTVGVGDTLRHVVLGSVENEYIVETIIPEGSPLIGLKYLILKDGTSNFGKNKGFYNVLYESLDRVSSVERIETPIYSLNYTNEDILCEDKDGDGYFYWGSGAKPLHCPPCAPDEPDGDDSNPLLGPMDEWGNCRLLIQPTELTEYITSNQTWDTKKQPCGNIEINNGVVTLTSELIMQPIATITVKNKGQLIISGGSIKKANIIVENGTLTVQNGGKIYLDNNDNIEIREEANYNFLYGEIIIEN